jgi:hypothetical protein
MANWTEEYRGTRLVTGTLEELLSEFWNIKANVVEYGIDGWLHDTGRLHHDLPIELATDGDLVDYAAAHRTSKGGCAKDPFHEWERRSSKIELEPEERTELARRMREWIRTRN